MNIAEFIHANGITLHSDPTAYNRYSRAWARDASHFSCRLYCRTTKKRMNLTYTHGPAIQHAPILSDVLETLRSDINILGESDDELRAMGISPVDADHLQRQEKRVRTWLGDDLVEQLLDTD